MHSQLLHNQWFGKAVGASCVWIWAPSDPVGLSLTVIAGIGLGHLYDLWAHRFVDDKQRLAGQLAGSVDEAPHLQFLFAGLGHIAKANGVVETKHIQYAEGLMLHLGLTSQARSTAISWFNEGKQSGFDFPALAQTCLGSDQQAVELRALCLTCFCELSALSANDRTVNVLKRLGQMLGFSPARIGTELGEAIPDQPAAPSSVDNPELRAAYDCLDLKPGANWPDTQRAYRRLVSRYHPDRLAQNATQRELDYAQQRMVEFREALETIQGHLNSS